jgi:hypothetical protein
MSCPQCEDLANRFDIRSPAELKRALTIAKSAVATGTIQEVAVREGGEPFSALSPDGPWDDIVSHRFQCRHCEQRFELTAETYHGSGGGWKAL